MWLVGFLLFGKELGSDSLHVQRSVCFLDDFHDLVNFNTEGHGEGFDDLS